MTHLRLSNGSKLLLRINSIAKIKCLRDDKGGEYMSTAFDDYLKAAGIHRQHTVRNEPHQNGVAECANRTIGEGVTAILKESRLPPSFWGLCVECLCLCACP